MTGTCQFDLGQSSAQATWSYDGSSLVVTPDGAASLTFALKELHGIAGDDYTLRVLVPNAEGLAELALSRLGHDGPTLAQAVRQDWLTARTDVLHLTGSGEGWLVSGTVEGLDSTPVSFRACLYDDVMVVGRDGGDLEPVFLALVEAASFDEGTYSVRLMEWPGRELVLSRLAKQTDELLIRLEKARSLLSQESAVTLEAFVPDLPAGSRASLAGLWMPGRLMQVAQMESLCPGFEQSFRRGWLAGALRREEGSYLMGGASTADVWLGCSREAEAGADDKSRTGDGAAAVAERPLWMLANREGVWFLEPLSIEDHATYCFKGGDEIPGLVSRLLCAPQFSKEALYTPLERLTGDRSDLAIPAAHLGFLVELRKRFAGRVVHQSVEGWIAEVERLI